MGVWVQQKPQMLMLLKECFLVWGLCVNVSGNFLEFLTTDNFVPDLCVPPGKIQ